MSTRAFVFCPSFRFWSKSDWAEVARNQNVQLLPKTPSRKCPVPELDGVVGSECDPLEVGEEERVKGDQEKLDDKREEVMLPEENNVKPTNDKNDVQVLKKKNKRVDGFDCGRKPVKKKSKAEREALRMKAREAAMKAVMEPVKNLFPYVSENLAQVDKLKTDHPGWLFILDPRQRKSVTLQEHMKTYGKSRDEYDHARTVMTFFQKFKMDLQLR